MTYSINGPGDAETFYGKTFEELTEFELATALIERDWLVAMVDLPGLEDCDRYADSVFDLEATLTAIRIKVAARRQELVSCPPRQ